MKSLRAVHSNQLVFKLWVYKGAIFVSNTFSIFFLRYDVKNSGDSFFFQYGISALIPLSSSSAIPYNGTFQLLSDASEIII